MGQVHVELKLRPKNLLFVSLEANGERQKCQRTVLTLSLLEYILHSEIFQTQTNIISTHKCNNLKPL